MEELLVSIANRAALFVQAVAVLVISYGALEAFVKLLRIVANPGTSHGQRKALWRRFGVWLVLGLEFELAGDIIGSVIAPSWQEIGKLGAIAVIRTFLNIFLEKDLEQAEGSRPAAQAAVLEAKSDRGGARRDLNTTPQGG